MYYCTRYSKLHDKWNVIKPVYKFKNNNYSNKYKNRNIVVSVNNTELELFLKYMMYFKLKNVMSKHSIDCIVNDIIRLINEVDCLFANAFNTIDKKYVIQCMNILIKKFQKLESYCNCVTIRNRICMYLECISMLKNKEYIFTPQSLE